MTFLNDEALIGAIRSGGAAEGAALEHIYVSNWQVLRSKIAQWGGTDEDAEEIFQIGVTELYHIIKHTDRFRGDSKVGTFLVSICRHLWLRELRKRKVADKNLRLYKDEQESIAMPEDLGDWVERQELVKLTLDKLDENCRELLIQVYYFKKSMDEVCEMLGLKNASVAKSKNWRCKEKLRSLMMQH